MPFATTLQLLPSLSMFGCGNNLLFLFDSRNSLFPPPLDSFVDWSSFSGELLSPKLCVYSIVSCDVDF